MSQSEAGAPRSAIWRRQAEEKREAAAKSGNQTTILIQGAQAEQLDRCADDLDDRQRDDMRTRNAIANDIVRAFNRLAEKHGANIPMGDLAALIYLVESELDGVRAAALAPSTDPERTK